MILDGGGSAIPDIQSKREIAHFRQNTTGHYASGPDCATLIPVIMCSSKHLVADCRQVYPSPDRSACSSGGPVTVFRLSFGGKQTDIGYHTSLAIELRTVSVDSGATSKNKLGRELCIKNQSFLPQWPFSALQVVLKATWNVASRAQAQVLLHLKCWAQTALVPFLLVPQLACFVTTPGSTPAVKRDLRASVAHLNQWSRRRGNTSAAVLRFGDGI
jgi:hypothetical protein